MQVYSYSASIYTNHWSMVCEYKPQHFYNYPNSPIHSSECNKFREIWIQVNKGTAFYQGDHQREGAIFLTFSRDQLISIRWAYPKRGIEEFLTSWRDQLRFIRWAQASTRTLQVYMKAKWCIKHQGVGDIIINFFCKDLHNLSNNISSELFYPLSIIHLLNHSEYVAPN